jgi:hypothetical protein
MPGSRERRTRSVLGGAVLLGLLAAGASASGADDVQALAWLSGTWVAEREGRWSEEHWTAPRGGVMLGVNRSGTEAGTRTFEFLRIQADADGIVTYWAMPNGATAVPFRLRSRAGQHVVFENPGHDYPTRIEYRRQGDELEATISGPDGTKPRSWRWTSRR